jgi:hypothetical protein
VHVCGLYLFFLFFKLSLFIFLFPWLDLGLHLDDERKGSVDAGLGPVHRNFLVGVSLCAKGKEPGLAREFCLTIRSFSSVNHCLRDDSAKFLPSVVNLARLEELFVLIGHINNRHELLS